MRQREERSPATTLAARGLAGCIVAVACVTAAPAYASETLELNPDPVVTGILIVAFAALVLPLNALIFRPLLRVMDEREARIGGARARAEQIQTQASEALSRYEEAILGAREEAVVDRRRQLDAARAELLQMTREAKEEAERELARAREELESSIGDARASLRSSAEDLAYISAERVLGRSLS